MGFLSHSLGEGLEPRDAFWGPAEQVSVPLEVSQKCSPGIWPH